MSVESEVVSCLAGSLMGRVMHESSHAKLNRRPTLVRRRMLGVRGGCSLTGSTKKGDGDVHGRSVG